MDYAWLRRTEPKSAWYKAETCKLSHHMITHTGMATSLLPVGLLILLFIRQQWGLCTAAIITSIELLELRYKSIVRPPLKNKGTFKVHFQKWTGEHLLVLNSNQRYTCQVCIGPIPSLQRTVIPTVTHKQILLLPLRRYLSETLPCNRNF